MRLNFPFPIGENFYQLVFLKVINDKGSKFKTHAIFKPKPTLQKNMALELLLEDIYFLNSLGNYKTDPFAKNVFVLSPTLQRFKEKDKLLICFQGDIFRYNSLIQGITIFNFKIDYN